MKKIYVLLAIVIAIIAHKIVMKSKEATKNDNKEELTIK